MFKWNCSSLCYITLQRRRVRLLGYGKPPKSRLLRKIESGDRGFIMNLYLSNGTKGESYKVSSSDKMWSLPYILCTLIIKYAFCDIFMLHKGRFLAVLYAYIVMKE